MHLTNKEILVAKWSDFVDLMTTVHCLEKLYGFQDFSTEFYNRAESLITSLCQEIGQDRTLRTIRSISPQFDLPPKSQILFNEINLWLNNQSSFIKHTSA